MTDYTVDATNVASPIDENDAKVADELRAIKVLLNDYIASSTAAIAAAAPPIGTILIWSSSTIPDNYFTLPIVPTALSRTTYAALYAAIGTTWGPGDGADTFNIPYCPINYAILYSDVFGDLTTGEIKAHTHTYSQAFVRGNQKPLSTGTAPYDSVTTTDTSSTGGSANLAAGQTFSLIIKYQ